MINDSFLTLTDYANRYKTQKNKINILAETVSRIIYGFHLEKETQLSDFYPKVRDIASKGAKRATYIIEDDGGAAGQKPTKRFRNVLFEAINGILFPFDEAYSEAEKMPNYLDGGADNKINFLPETAKILAAYHAAQGNEFSEQYFARIIAKYEAKKEAKKTRKKKVETPFVPDMDIDSVFYD